MWDNGSGGGKSVPKLPLTEQLYWDAMRAKWPGSAIRYAAWLSDDPVISELQGALAQKLRMEYGYPSTTWQQPGKYDTQTLQALVTYMELAGLPVPPDGVMTGSIYQSLGVTYTSLYPLPYSPVGEPPVVESKNIWYILAAFGGAFATYQIVAKLIKGKGISKKKRR
jgi:hypothetical protein